MILGDVILFLLTIVCLWTAVSLETVNVKLGDDHRFTAKKHGRSIIDDLPETLAFTFPVTGTPTTLTLKHNKNIDITKPVYSMRDGVIQAEILASKIKYYHDLGNNAAIGVSCLETDGNCFHQLEGILSKGGKSFRISPIERRELSYAQLNEQHNHELREVNDSLDLGNDYIIPDNYTRKKFEKRPRVKATKMTYNVEVLMVTDYSVYEFWFSISPGPTTAEKHSQTWDSIRRYYALILNKVDLRYKGIQEGDIAFNVLYSGIFIADHPTIATWTEGIVSADRKIDSDIALEEFTTWRNSQAGLPENDHAMLFTKYEMWRYTTFSTYAIAGMAYIGTICSSKGTSINQQGDRGIGESTPAHELGHSLGAQHDGRSNNCSLTKYTMATTSGEDNFSSCSVDDFRQMVAKLDLDDSNCLLMESSMYNPDALKPYEPIFLYPGQHYDADTQCILRYGEGSYVCRGGGSTGSFMCKYGMKCHKPGTKGTCYIMVKPILRGTTCEDRKWCVDDECIEDPEAPSVPASCVHGDYPDIVETGNLTCTELIQQNPYGCVTGLGKYYCCESCGSIKTDIAGCEYGDRNSSECDVQSCPEYSEHKRTTTCCATCRTPESTTTAQPTTTTTSQITTTPTQPSVTTTTQSKTTAIIPTTTTTTQPSTTCTCCAVCPTLEKYTTPQHTSTTTRQPTTAMLQPKTITTTQPITRTVQPTTTTNKQPETTTVQPKTTTKQRLKSTPIQPTTTTTQPTTTTIQLTTTTTTQPTTTKIQPITTTAAQSTQAQLTTTTTTQHTSTETTTPRETTTNETTPHETTTPELTTTSDPCANLTMKPHETDCRKYYYCYSEVWYEKSCCQNTVFDASATPPGCVHEELAPCQLPGPKECPSEWVPHGRSCYYFQLSKMSLTYDMAEQQCDTKYPGSHLVSIETREEFNFLKGYLINKHSSILNNIGSGFLTSGKRVNGTWKWISTGDEIDFTHLQVGNWRPNDFPLDCLSFWPSWQYYIAVMYCRQQNRQFICEI